MQESHIGPMLKLLAERSRASADFVDSFRPPHAGIVDQIGANQHQIVSGRRGVGKSMLLLSLAAKAEGSGTPVVYVDLERYRNTPYPDVLIKLLIEVSQELANSLSELPVLERLKLRRLRKELALVQSRMEELALEPQNRSVVVQDSDTTKQDVSQKGEFDIGSDRQGLSAQIGAQSKLSGSSSRSTASQAEFRITKMDGLHREAPVYGALLGQAVEALGGDHAVLVLDDFYFVPREHQPDVLAYLHQVLKGRRIWLKVGGVQHRLTPFREGDPPTGLQPHHDAGMMTLDATLRDYSNTKNFLEEILAGIGTEIGIELTDIASDTGLERLVLASGGVPRDYINIAAAALRQSNQRENKPNRPANKINAEDISYVAPEFLKQKEEDLGLDASNSDVDRLRKRFDDLVAFCVHDKKRNTFLVEATRLREDQWGRDIQALADLRFVHLIGNLTVKSSNPKYTGRRYEAFVLDLSAYTGTRVTQKIDQIRFWTTDGFQKMRGVSYIYTPTNDGSRQVDPIALAVADGEQLELDLDEPALDR